MIAGITDFTNTWVVIAAYNEAAAIQNTVEAACRVFAHVVVVDDCSSDSTSEISYNAGAHVVRHPINLGQGAALQTGIDFALSKGAQVIVTFDGDGQHSSEDALAMARHLKHRNLDVVLGSRFKGSAVGISKAKEIFLKVATVYTRWTTGLRITDTHNGLRAISASAARKMKIRQNRMAHASEILHLIASLRMRYEEYPCTIQYSKYSKKKGQRMTGALDILVDLLAGRLSK